MAKKRHYARRAYRKIRRSTAGKKIPLAVVLGIVGGPAVSNSIISMSQGDWPGALNWAKSFVGITPTGTFDFDRLKNNMLPLTAGILVHKLAGMSGVNRAIRKIPYVQV